MPYDTIFFDLDHTLWDFETNSRETLQDLYHELNLSTLGIPAFEHFHDTYHHHNTIFWDRFRKGFITRDELRWKRMWRTLIEYKVYNEPLALQISERYLEILPTKKHLFTDAIHVLDYLKAKNYPLFLITNGFQQTQIQKLKHSGITHYFDYMITSEEAGIMKPHAAIFEMALQIAKAKASTSIMIGDTLEADIEGGINAGIDTVYFNPSVPAVGKIQPTFVIQSLKELKNIL